MKKLLLMMSLLLTFSMFCACSSNDEMIVPNSTDDVFGDSSESSKDSVDSIGLIQSVEGFDGYAEIAEFFNSELPCNTGDIQSSYFFKESENECVHYVINNKEDLEALYYGSRMLPKIDFEKYTFIIGVEVFPHLLFFLEKKELTFEKGNLQLNLYVSETKDSYCPTALLNMYFWGIYPKIETNEVSVNVIKVEA